MTSASLPIDRRTLVDHALDILRERILAGHYPERFQLRQDALAAELGVSRIPLREALRRLEAEGLVTIVPHRGAIVTAWSTDEIDELFDLRTRLEVDLLQRAIPNASAAHGNEVDALRLAFDHALADHQIADWGIANWRLHAALYAPANRPLTLNVVERLHRHADRFMRMQLSLTHGETLASREHLALTTAYRARDIPRATELLTAHIDGARARLVAFLREHRTAAAPDPS